jgi:hypothetical protein
VVVGRQGAYAAPSRLHAKVAGSSAATANVHTSAVVATVLTVVTGAVRSTGVPEDDGVRRARLRCDATRSVARSVSDGSLVVAVGDGTAVGDGVREGRSDDREWAR